MATREQGTELPRTSTQEMAGPGLAQCEPGAPTRWPVWCPGGLSTASSGACHSPGPCWPRCACVFCSPSWLQAWWGWWPTSGQGDRALAPAPRAATLWRTRSGHPRPLVSGGQSHVRPLGRGQASLCPTGHPAGPRHCVPSACHSSSVLSRRVAQREAQEEACPLTGGKWRPSRGARGRVSCPGH